MTDTTDASKPVTDTTAVPPVTPPAPETPAPAPKTPDVVFNTSPAWIQVGNASWANPDKFATLRGTAGEFRLSDGANSITIEPAFVKSVAKALGIKL